jgi:hypothetical protein
MGTTTIVPILDDININCTYYRDFLPDEDTSPVDLTVFVKHRYTTTTNVVKEITLETFTIPKQYLETKGLAYLSDVEQTVEFNISNLRYMADIYIEVQEIREGVPVTTLVAVNKGDDATIDPLVDNPQKDIENDENIPEIKPDINISDPVQDFSTVIFEFDATEQNLIAQQVSKRIYLDNDTFVSMDYNEVDNRVFVENSIDNMAPNPSLATTGSIPTGWRIEAPGMIVNSHIQESDIPDINIWMLRITNPNLFSAFNAVTIVMVDSCNVINGLNTLSFSFYYRIKSTTSEIPFNLFNFRFKFYFDDVEIGVESISTSLSSLQNTWHLATATVQGSQIPTNANKVAVETDIAEIDTTDLFSLEFYLPQLEPSAYSTTRTLDNRIQDRFLTPEITLDLPFYLALKTIHIVGPSQRGLFASTLNLRDGFEIQVSSDRLFFKQYGAAGNLLLSVASSSFTLIEGTEAEYGFWTDGSHIEFYVNGTLVSSHTVSLTLDQTKAFIVGSLERSNSTINSELLEFKLLRVKP